MNTIDTSKTGGHPLYLQDVGFIQEAYKEALEGINSALGADSYILSGCVKTLKSAGVWAISEGFVVLEKEVFKVNAHTATFLNESDPLFFKITQQYAEPSPVIYKESGVQNVHIERRVIVTTEVNDWVFGLPSMSTLVSRSQISDAFEIPCLAGYEGKFYGRICHGFFYLFGSCTSTISNPFGTPFIEIPAKYTPLILDTNESFGSHPQLNITNINIAGKMVRQEFMFSVNYYNSSNNIILTRFDQPNSVLWGAYLLNTAPPRTMSLDLYPNGNVPAGTSKVEIKIPMGSAMWPVKI